MDLKIFIWNGPADQELTDWSDDGTLVALAHEPEEARRLMLDQRKQSGSHESHNGRLPDRVVELDRPKIIAVIGKEHD